MLLMCIRGSSVTARSTKQGGSDTSELTEAPTGEWTIPDTFWHSQARREKVE